MVSLVHEALPDGLSIRKRRMGDILMSPSRHQPTFATRHERTCRIERSPQTGPGSREPYMGPESDPCQNNSEPTGPGSRPAHPPSRPAGLLREPYLSDCRCRHCGSRRPHSDNRLNFGVIYCRIPGTSCRRAWGHGTVGWLRRPESTVGTSALYRTCRSSMISACGTGPQAR